MSSLSSTIINELGTTLVFGLGLYLFKSFKTKTNQKSKVTSLSSDSESEDEEVWNDPKKAKLNSIKSKIEGALANYSYAKTGDDYQKLMKKDYKHVPTDDPFLLLNKMSSQGIVPTIETYNYLLYSSYNNNVDQRKCDELLQEILDPTGPATPNLYTLNIIIKGLYYKNKDNTAQDFTGFERELSKYIDHFENNSIKIDITTQNVIGECYVDSNRINSAWDHYTKMKTKFKPDFHTIRIGLDGIRKEKIQSVEWVKRALDLIEQSKLCYEIDCQFFNYLIDSCVNFNFTEKAVELYNEYKNKINLDDDSYTIMIKCYSKLYELERAMEMYRNINNKSNKTYTNIISCCIRCYNYTQGGDIYNSINISNLTCDILTLILVIFKKTSEWNKILNIFEQFKNEKFDFLPSINIINSFIDSASELQNIEIINDIISFSKSRNITGDSRSIYLLLTIYCTGGLSNEIEKIYNSETKLDQGLYKKLVEMYIHNNLNEKAGNVISDMKAHGMEVLEYSNEVSFQIFKNNPSKSFELFNECMKQKQPLKKEIYNGLILLQIEHGFSDRVITLYKSMGVNNVERDLDVVEHVCNDLIKHNQIKSGCEVCIRAGEEDAFHYLDKGIFEKLPGLINNADQSDMKVYEKDEAMEMIYELLYQKKEFDMVDKYDSFFNSAYGYKCKEQGHHKGKCMRTMGRSKMKGINKNSEKKKNQNDGVSIYDTNVVIKSNVKKEVSIYDAGCNNNKSSGNISHRKKQQNGGNEKKGYCNKGNNYGRSLACQEISIYS